MSEITLFEIPEFRRKAKFLLINIFDEINSLKIGSTEWITLMSEKILLKDFTTLEVPTNLDDFIKIKRFSDFIEDENPIPFYIFAYLFKEEVIEYLVKELTELINDENVDFFMLSDEEKQKYKDHLSKYEFIKIIQNDRFIIDNRDKVLISAKDMSKMGLSYNHELNDFIELLEKTCLYDLGCCIECEEGYFNISLQFMSCGIISSVFFSEYKNWKDFLNFLEEGDDFQIQESDDSTGVELNDDILTFQMTDNSNIKATTTNIIFNDLNREHILKQLEFIDKECIDQREHDKKYADVYYPDIPEYEVKTKYLTFKKDIMHEELNENSRNPTDFFNPSYLQQFPQQLGQQLSQFILDQMNFHEQQFPLPPP